MSCHVKNEAAAVDKKSDLLKLLINTYVPREHNTKRLEIMAIFPIVSHSIEVGVIE